MSSLALISTVRLGSTRLPEKMIKPFGDGTTMLSRLIHRMDKARQFYEFSRVCIAAHPGDIPVVNEILGSNVPILLRSDQSCASDRLSEIFDFVRDFEEDYILWVNGGNPFLRPESLAHVAGMWDAIKGKYTAAKVRRNWFWYPDGEPIVFPCSGKTQDSSPIYEATHSFHLFKKKDLELSGTYWGGESPEAFIVDDDEAVDVDTEEDFRYADYLVKEGK